MKDTVINSHTLPKRVSAIRPKKGDFFMLRPAYLSLADGTRFQGMSPLWEVDSDEGEVVFNTGMTGYVESLTDPSYANQILVFTYPLIGNYGVHDQAVWESVKVQVSGVVMSEIAPHYSHAGSYQSLLKWLHENRVPVITSVDTRAVTKHLRGHGTMQGAISEKPKRRFRVPQAADNSGVTEPIIYNQQHKMRVILVDCGLKENILRSICGYPVSVKRVPAGYDYTNEAYEGIILSNGPGDPTDYQQTIAVARQALAANKPVFGICLGSQIMGLAAGAKTYKLQYGHRGHNQPCITTIDEKCVITSQNHGYALDEKTLPKDWRVSYRNLNDNSIEGIAHKSKPFFSVQFHPEACPGPTDSKDLFERFYQTL